MKRRIPDTSYMASQKGFTLMELIVVIVILGILTAIAIPTYSNVMEQGMAQSAYNNLEAIYAAQRIYYFNHNSYCVNACSSSLSTLNTNLSLNLTDSNFTYSCFTNYGDPTYQCSTHENINWSYTITLYGKTPLSTVSNPPNPYCINQGSPGCPSSVPLA